MRDTAPSITIVETFTHDIGFESSETSRADQRRMGDADAGWRSAIVPAETDDDVQADHCETHLLADEALCCMCGAVRLYFRGRWEAADGVAQLVPGQAATQRD
jgi:hypothetical protein